jgi:chromate reductase
MKVAVISTSPRMGSNSLKVAKYIQFLVEEQGVNEVGLANFENVDIPMVGRGSLDQDNLTPFQQNLIATWGAADVVIFTVPEYNWITSGELINAMHQLGGKPFAHLFDKKVFALVGVSSGRGGRRPALEITTLTNKLISFLNKYSIISPKLFESHETGDNLTEDGESIGNNIYEHGASDFVQYTLRIAKQWHGVL